MPLNSGFSYHQKAVLVENIIGYIRNIGAISLLDIGAGSVETAIPLSSAVREYQAIEQDPARVAELRAAGLCVTQGRFPLPLTGSYDLVLSSHSVPELSIDSYVPFLSAAWNATKTNGALLIITFKGNQGDLASIRFELLGQTPDRSKELDTVLGYLRSVGGIPSIERINSYIEATNPIDIATFLSPWLSGNENIRSAINDPFVRLLRCRYRVRADLFVFPTEHLFISCHKR
jgi:hypothetical protein